MTDMTGLSIRGIAIAFIAVLLAACEPSPPSEADARVALEHMMRAHFPKAQKINVTLFTKTNGQSMNVAGVSVYRMYYQATIEFPQGFVPAPTDVFGELLTGSNVMGALMMLSSSGFSVTKGGKPSDPQVLQA
ncbi:MAG: hypothetical protein ACREC6_09150, partial [Hyphomicrobiaceae bacterium]